jgi:serine/threonine-protein kinase
MQGITPFAPRPQFTLQQVIDKRYQILNTLGRRLWERTYLAVDTRSSGNPGCVVKEFCLHNNSPQTLQAVNARFEYEKNLMTALGGYSQMAQLLNLIVTEHAVYLVREFIVGQPLRSQATEVGEGDRWPEDQVRDFLIDVLTTLQFVHSKAGIHGNLHPGNLIRRERDGRFVLTDVCALAPLGMLLAEVQIAETMPGKLDRLGYFAKEQIWHRPRPSSDLYSLGMIAIDLLTGLRPWEIPRDPETGQLLWQKHVTVGGSLTEVLTAMTRDHYGDRPASAHEALTFLKAPTSTHRFIAKVRQKRQRKAGANIRPDPVSLPANPDAAPRPLVQNPEPQNPEPDAVKANRSEGDPTNGFKPLINDGTTSEWGEISNPSSEEPKTAGRADRPLSSPESSQRAWKKSQRAVMLSAVTIAGGAIALAHVPLLSAVSQNLTALDPATQRLYQADRHYQSGEIVQAIALAESIESTHPSFSLAQTVARQWQAEWERSVDAFAALQGAYEVEDWRTVLHWGTAIAPTPFWQAQTAPFLQQAQQQIDRQGHDALQAAFNHAYEQRFIEAMDALRRIPPESNAYAQVPSKFVEYEQKRDIRAHYYLQQAYDEAQDLNFAQAIAYLQRIMPETPVYAIAQVKQVEYAEKLHLRQRQGRS